MNPTIDNAQQERCICGFCGFPLDPSARFCEGCAETYQVNRQFRREGIRLLIITLTFICSWVGLAAWMQLDLPTSLSVGLLVAIAGMTFGLMYCDALEDQHRPKR
jgi:predicted nucleic acid-binding Zn ribbon protein